jgi:hypothetical protein
MLVKNKYPNKKPGKLKSSGELRQGSGGVDVCTVAAAGTGHKKEQKRSLIWRFNNTPAKAARERFKENHGHLQA